MTQYLNPFSGRQFLDANGDPYAGAKLFTYSAGSSTKVTTTKDQAGLSNHANPIVLNSRGEIAETGGSSSAYPIWQTGGQSLKLVLAPANDTDPPTSPIESWDNLVGINDSSVTLDQWVAGPTPTYVSSTSFTLVGDQTTDFHVGRRLKLSDSGGTDYATIQSSAYTTLTTIVVQVDGGGSLDSGLSAVWYGLLAKDNHALPISVFSRIPAGTMLEYGGSSNPTELEPDGRNAYLLCDGTAYSRTTYASLFSAISTTFGVGDGSTTFNVPDRRGRSGVGAGTGTLSEAVAEGSWTNSSGLTAAVTSNAAKWITGMVVQLTTTGTLPTGLSLATNYYIIRSSATAVKFATSLANAQNGTAISFTDDGTGTHTFTHTLTARTLGEKLGEETHAMSITELLAHTHNIPEVTGSASGGQPRCPSDATDGGFDSQTTSTGGNAAMNNMQPGLVLNYIIKT